MTTLILLSASTRTQFIATYVGQNESAKFWLSILNGLKNRGVEDILIACVDGLTGFPQAIEAVFPQTEIQQCLSLIHISFMVLLIVLLVLSLDLLLSSSAVSTFSLVFTFLSEDSQIG